MSLSSLQVDLVCHGKTEVFPDKDEVDPYSVSPRWRTFQNKSTILFIS